VIAQTEGRLNFLNRFARNLSQPVNNQLPIFCMVIVIVGESPAVLLYETQ
jgi:hypothetical protein